MSQTNEVLRGDMPCHRSADKAFFLAILLLAFWVYLGGAHSRAGLFTSAEPSGYYGLLTEALLAGQLHLKITPDPKLALLENPYAGPQGTLRPHDMSYYRGRFYLYYGITPALILFVPWKLASGCYLQESVGTALFCFGAFALSAWWLLGVKRRLWPALAPSWFAFALGLLAFGSPLFFLANNPTFYAVPISSASFCLLAGFVAMDHALGSTKLSAQFAWLAGASLALGLAVGARPICLLGLPLLLVPVAWLWRQRGRDGQRHKTALYLLAAIIAPAALIGVGLAIYNYLRFGSPFDFGIQYSMASAQHPRGKELLGPHFIIKNLWAYLFQPAAHSRYYPFFETNGRPFGVLPNLPFVAMSLLLPLTWLKAGRRDKSRWIVATSVIAGLSLANLAMLSLFFGGEDRYLVDFVPGLMLVATTVMLAALAPERGWVSGGARRGLGALFILVAGYTLFNSVFLALPHRAHPEQRQWLERLANLPAHAWERFIGTQHGSLALAVQFPVGLAGQADPLVTTGNLLGTADIVYVHYEDSNHVRFGYFHRGAGGPLSEPIPLDFTQTHHLEIRAGGLLPPAGHPLFNGQTSAQIARARRYLELTLNGKPVLRGAVSAYPSTPDRILIGENPLLVAASVRFRGKIISAIRHPWSPLLPKFGIGADVGPARLRVRFPTGHIGISEPLISTGPVGAGDVFFVRYTGPDRVQFGHDNTGAGSIVSREIITDFSRTHDLEIEMGSLYPPGDDTLATSSADAAKLRQTLLVRLDGKVVLRTTRPFAPSTADQVEFGYNAIAASSAEQMFTGTIDGVSRLSLPKLDDVIAKQWGAVRLTVEWPVGMNGASDPLLVTGVVGAADIIYVHYVDSHHVRFGLDHWSLGGPLSDPVTIDPDHLQKIEISLASLYPPPNSPAWGSRSAAERSKLTNRTIVKLDNVVVLDSGLMAYPAALDEVAIGENYLGASTCRVVFSGTILEKERLPW